MKLVFLASTFMLLYLIRQHRVIKQTYDKDYDTFRVVFLIIPCLFMALFVHDRVHAKKRPILEVSLQGEPGHCGVGIWDGLLQPGGPEPGFV